MVTGRIHSIETFGTVDGPGIRLVVFLQGCPLRCLYCHNPDTWKQSGGTEMTVEQILELYEKNRNFYSRGGITATGGEPLLQMEFVTELFEKAAGRGIHTCLDTSGITFPVSGTGAVNTDRVSVMAAGASADDCSFLEVTPEKADARMSGMEHFYADYSRTLRQFDRLTAVTDLVMLDIKHIDPEGHKKLTGQSLAPVLAFARYLEKRSVPVWIRHVVVPGITQDPEQLYQLGCFIGSLHNVTALDVLPYHDMGKTKYRELGMKYALENTLPLSQEEALAARQIILKGIRTVRIKH